MSELVAVFWFGVAIVVIVGVFYLRKRGAIDEGKAKDALRDLVDKISK